MTKLEQEKLNKALIATLHHDWELANEILNGFGIEYVSVKGQELKYINMGDTYIDTVCQEIEFGSKPVKPPFISNWGGWYEQAEQDYCQKTDTIRCGYCSEFTPNNKENWYEIVCESCGNLVGG